MALSSDGQTIATGGKGQIIIWDATGRERLSINAHINNWVTALSFSPDGRTIVSGSEYRTARVYDAANGKEQLIGLENLYRRARREERGEWVEMIVGFLSSVDLEQYSNVPKELAGVTDLLMVRIGRTEVRAPVAGVISRRTAKLGATAALAGEPLFRIISDGAIDLYAEVPEQWLPQLKVGMPATLKLPGLDTPVVGKVRLVDQEVDKASRTGKARIALADPTHAHLGAFASGEVDGDEPRATIG